MKNVKNIQLVFLLFLLGLTNAPALAKEISGAEVINNNCARCHNARATHEFSMSEWQVIMPHMREKAHLTGEETQAVLDFIGLTKGLQTKEDVLPVTQEAKTGNEGKRLLTQFGCQGCHSIDGTGGSVGPTLDGIIAAKGEEFFKKKLKNPQFNNPASPMPPMPLTDEQIEEIVVFLKQN